jgi:hypothetical protein
MMHPSHSARIRPTALALVLLAHVPLLLLFVWGWRVSRDEPEQEVVFLSLWPQTPTEKPATPQPSPLRPTRKVSATPPPRRPADAIDSPESIAPETAPSEPSRPSIDWRAEGAAAAARQAVPTPSAEFAAPPKTVHKPCEKQQSTWEWNKEEKSYGIAPLPYVKLGKRCVVGLGFFGCALQKPPEANSHLLDDMHDGKTSPSSVPDAERCD